MRAHKPSPPTMRRAAAFSLIELLVVISIIALIIAILLPSLASARQESQRAFCLSSLRQLGMASSAYSNEDRFAQMLSAPHNADRVALVDGIYDYGGESCSVDSGDTALMSVWGSESPNRAENRPINRMLFGGPPAPGQARLFQCPGDFGWVEAPGEPRSLAYTGFIGQPFWKCTGTSYRANCCRASAGLPAMINAPLTYYEGLQNVFSMGPYLRSASRLTQVSDLVLYCESIMWEALWNSRAIDGHGVADLPGWHGRMTSFNAVFFDGHARGASLSANNTEFGDELHERGPDWRFDTLPEPLIPDKALGAIQ